MRFTQKISEEIFNKKYCLHGETTPEEVFEKVAEEIASAEKTDELKLKWKEKFYVEINSGRFIPGGRILANARPDSKMKNYNNCFTIGIEDSIEGIYQALKEDAMISKEGGGVGFDISSLRPENSTLSTKGTASGPISFLKVFDASAKSILTGGQRRSAHIALMDISHPDIEQFIIAKQGDSNKALTQFNLSVKITDKFIDAVEKDLDWDLVFKGKVYKTVKAKYLYNLITKNSFINNEPGILNIDNVEKYNNGYWAFKQNTVNPCFSGNEKLLTTDGYMTFEELDGTEPFIINNEGNVVKSKVWKSGKKKTIVLKLSNGQEITCTPDHIFMTNSKEELEAKDLKNKRLDTFVFQNNDFDTLYEKMGFIQGDGNTSRLSPSSKHKGLEINIGQNDEDIAKLFDYKDWSKENRSFYTSEYTDDLNSIGMSDNTLPGRNLPFKYNDFSIKQRKSFLRGLFSANGGVIKNYRVSFKSTNKFLIDTLKLELKDLLGITAYITTNKSKVVEFNNGKYLCKESYDLNIGKFEDLVKFYENIGFIHSYKTKDLLDLITQKMPMVISIKEGEEIDVYDFIEPENHWGIVNGYIVHNCGEIVMPENSLCCLGSLNLTCFIKNPFTETAEFDFNLFQESIYIAIRFLDNVLDVCSYPLEKIKQTSLDWRRVGLGFTGLADAFAMLKIVYGNKESKIIAEKIAEHLMKHSYFASTILANEKGAFPKYDEKILQSNFIKKIEKSHRALWNEIELHGLRNIGLNTCAPTGTISLSLGNNCSSGIEPIFSKEYDRTIRTNLAKEETKKEKVYDYAYLLFKHLYPNSETPEYFVSTIDIEPKDQIDIQAIFQDYIDHSISKTLNLKSGTTFEEYKELYLYAYKQGLKGFTTFNPDGNMKGILEVEKKEEKIFSCGRPEKLKAEIHRITVKGEKWIVFVGLLDEKPYEIFAGRVEMVDIPSKIKEGEIIKRGSGKYEIEIDGETIIKDINAIFRNDVHEGFTRMISMSLRNNVNVQAVVEQLSKSKGSIANFEKCLMNALKKYVKEGNKSEISCECGEKYVFIEGCLVCPSCANSRCS